MTHGPSIPSRTEADNDLKGAAPPSAPVARQPGTLAGGTRGDRSRLVLATDLDGTFLGGDPEQRRSLYEWIEKRRQLVTLIFVTGRDLPFIRALIAGGSVPRPDYVIGDVGTTIAGGPGIEPLGALETTVAQLWGDAGARVDALLEGEPGLRLQDTPFRYRRSYFYDPDLLVRSTLEKIEAAGFDWLLSADTYLDVLPRGVSKGPTLLKLVGHLELPHSHVMTAGDTLNDLSLFETGLTGVAVGNSETSLKVRVAGMPNVYLSALPGAAGILDAVRHFEFL
ncbi:MAG: HAD family hydrolase [Burkholderiaceae bacterium]